MWLDKIDREVVLLVEGVDDQAVVGLLLSALSPDWKQVIDVQRLAQTSTFFDGLLGLETISGFDGVKKVALLMDADDEPEKLNIFWAQEQKAFVLRNPGLQLSYCVLPSSGVKGALESVFLQSLDADNPNFACVQIFSSCVADHTPHTTQAQRDKLALTTYINSKVKNPYSRIGVALEQDAKDLFDFKHPAFKPLVEFLESLTHV